MQLKKLKNKIFFITTCFLFFQTYINADITHKYGKRSGNVFTITNKKIEELNSKTSDVKLTDKVKIKIGENVETKINGIDNIALPYEFTKSVIEKIDSGTIKKPLTLDVSDSSLKEKNITLYEIDGKSNYASTDPNDNPFILVIEADPDISYIEPPTAPQPTEVEVNTFDLDDAAKFNNFIKIIINAQRLKKKEKTSEAAAELKTLIDDNKIEIPAGLENVSPGATYRYNSWTTNGITNYLKKNKQIDSYFYTVKQFCEKNKTQAVAKKYLAFLWLEDLDNFLNETDWKDPSSDTFAKVIKNLIKINADTKENEGELNFTNAKNNIKDLAKSTKKGHDKINRSFLDILIKINEFAPIKKLTIKNQSNLETIPNKVIEKLTALTLLDVSNNSDLENISEAIISWGEKSGNTLNISGTKYKIDLDTRSEEKTEEEKAEAEKATAEEAFNNAADAAVNIANAAKTAADKAVEAKGDANTDAKFAKDATIEAKTALDKITADAKTDPEKATTADKTNANDALESVKEFEGFKTKVAESLKKAKEKKTEAEKKKTKAETEIAKVTDGAPNTAKAYKKAAEKTLNDNIFKFTNWDTEITAINKIVSDAETAADIDNIKTEAGKITGGISAELKQKIEKLTEEAKKTPKRSYLKLDTKTEKENIIKWAKAILDADADMKDKVKEIVSRRGRIPIKMSQLNKVIQGTDINNPALRRLNPSIQLDILREATK